MIQNYWSARGRCVINNRYSKYNVKIRHTIWSLTTEPSITLSTVLQSTFIVCISPPKSFMVNELLQNLTIKLVFPTPEFPTTTTSYTLLLSSSSMVIIITLLNPVLAKGYGWVDYDVLCAFFFFCFSFFSVRIAQKRVR